MLGGKEVRVKTVILMTVISAILLAAVPAFAQRVVNPNELKISPAKYKNQTIKLNDKFVLNRAGLSPALTAAGYSLNKYITFGVTGAGMRCFIHRTPALEKLVGELKKGDRITIIGTVKQPKAKVKRAGGRVTDRYKLDMYIIEARNISRGWES